MQVYFFLFFDFSIFAGYPQAFLFLVPLSTYSQINCPTNGPVLLNSSQPARAMILSGNVLFIELFKYIRCQTDRLQTAHIVLLIDFHQL